MIILLIINNYVLVHIIQYTYTLCSVNNVFLNNNGTVTYEIIASNLAFKALLRQIGPVEAKLGQWRLKWSM